MKRILGLDLGVTSIGWALVAENEDHREILGMGSRIIPLSTDEKDEFSRGNAISKNQARTAKRTQRKGYDRYQLRRKYLYSKLREFGMVPQEELINLPANVLYGLRDRALKEKVSLNELGRILLHLNQRRGYKSGRKETLIDKKETDYVAEVMGRFSKIKEDNLTIGQYFFKGLTLNQTSEEWPQFAARYSLNPKLIFTIKKQVFPREAYIEEFDKICRSQQIYYPEILNENFITTLRDNIIYYQRKLKSQKGLVSICGFEGFMTRDKEGKDIYTGPKVIPKSAPLFQICKIWENINNIKISNKRGENFHIDLDQKRKIFEYLNDHERLTFNELMKILGLKTLDGWYGNKQLQNGLQGNLTRCKLKKCFKDSEKYHDFLGFSLLTEIHEKVERLLKKTGEITKERILIDNIESWNLNKLWHVLYSAEDKGKLVMTLKRKYGIDDDTAKNLSDIDFKTGGYGNKSAKAIKKILPYLMEGYVYSDACQLAGYDHSNSLTQKENLQRKLEKRLQILPKNSLRQPVVEKILNQMILIVNGLMDKYGEIDEIRIELARELKQSKDERNETFKNISRIEKENKAIAETLSNEFGLRPTRHNIQKYRLFKEIQGDESKVNAICVYCGKSIGITQALRGDEVDIEHIIPRSKYFDDSLNNKTLSHRACNEAKGNQTAFDYIRSKGSLELEAYIERVEKLFKGKIINKAKRDKLLMSEDKIPQDFINRQLRESQYIARKSREILQEVCRDVWLTSGSVTEYLRRIWGWDDVLMNLQLKNYKERELFDLIDTRKIEDEQGNIKEKEVISGWTKRDDHRHHAIDALTIACTKQRYIQRINTLSSEKTREILYTEVKEKMDYRKSVLENYIYSQKPFSTAEVEDAASRIIISFKPGKRVASMGRRTVKIGKKKIVAQKGIIVPRGPLSEESVYGKIKTLEKGVPLKKLFEIPEKICKKYIRDKVLTRIEENGNDRKKAYQSCLKNPIWLDKDQKVKLEYASVYQEKYVLKYPVTSLERKDIKSVVDFKVKQLLEQRFALFNNNEKEALKDIENNPIWLNEDKKIPLKTVRLFTGLDSLASIKKDSSGREIGFVKPGNNHHIAFYIDETGKWQEHVVTFWHAVERKQYGCPVIIKNPDEVWDVLQSSAREYPDSFIQNLPKPKWIFKTSFQQNEIFVLGLNKDLVEELIRYKKLGELSKNIFRVQKLSPSYYVFRHHLETSVEDKYGGNKNEALSIKAGKMVRVQSEGALQKINPVKISINNLGEIVRIEE